MQNGILPLNDESLKLIHQKHPAPKEADADILLQGEKPRVHPVIYDVIDEEMVKKAALHTKGGSGPSGLDADGWRRILASNQYGTLNVDLRRAFSEDIKMLCVQKIEIDQQHNTTSLEALIACRLIPLDKNPGLRPIGVGEVLRRIAGKVVMKVVKDDVMTSVGSLQLCGGEDAGCEAAIRAMHDIFEDTETEAVLLVDADNAFNSINRKALLHNIEYLCPSIYTFVYNCYIVPAGLLIIGGCKLRSQEGTQGDPTAMGTYAIGLTPMINELLDLHSAVKSVAFSDDLTGAGKSLKLWWDQLRLNGPKYGYYPKPAKSYLVVKEQFLNQAKAIFEGSDIKITTSGARHLGAALGNSRYKEEYIEIIITSWKAQLQLL